MKVTVYSLDKFLSQFWTSPCFRPGSSCCFLTHVQVSQEMGKVVWYSHLLKNFPQFVVIHTVKSLSIINEAEVDVFLELSCLFSDPADVDNLISGSSAFSKSSLYIWKFLVHIMVKPSFKDFEHNLASMWNGCNYVVIWMFFVIAFLWDWNENWLFPVLWCELSHSTRLAQKFSIGGNLNHALVLLGHAALSVQFWLCNVLSSCSDFMQAESECHSFLMSIHYF